MQTFHDIFVNPDFWTNQKIIRVNNNSITDIIGIQGKYASFSDFFTESNQYKLEEFGKQKETCEKEPYCQKIRANIIKCRFEHCPA